MTMVFEEWVKKQATADADANAKIRGFFAALRMTAIGDVGCDSFWGKREHPGGPGMLAFQRRQIGAEKPRPVGRKRIRQTELNGEG
jgi:hypothetical protein